MMLKKKDESFLVPSYSYYNVEEQETDSQHLSIKNN